jgi:hypothetical protein
MEHEQIIRILTQQKTNVLLITKELAVLITVHDPLPPDFG